MGRSVDAHSGIAGRQAASQLGAIRAGLANGSMVRGTTAREVRGSGRPPTWGAILLPGQVDAVTPPLGRGQTAIGWADLAYPVFDRRSTAFHAERLLRLSAPDDSRVFPTISGDGDAGLRRATIRPTPMSPDALVLHPSTVTLSRAGDALPVLAVPWFLGMLTVHGALYPDMGPVGTQLVAVLVAVAPIALFLGSPVLGRVPGLRWLLATPQPLATLDGDEIELALPRVGVRRFRWQQIDRLELHETWRRRWGELRALDGSLLAIVPCDLVYLKGTWRTAPTLAEAVVRTRPDLFVLTGAAWGRPDAFARPGPMIVPVDVVAVEQAHARWVRAAVGSLAVVGACLVLVLLLRPA